MPAGSVSNGQPMTSMSVSTPAAIQVNCKRREKTRFLSHAMLRVVQCSIAVAAACHCGEWG